MQRVEASRSRWPIVAVAVALAGAGLWWLRGAGEPTAAPVDADAGGELAQASLPSGPRDRPELVLDPRIGERAAISGMVKDRAGRPLAGAQVCAQAESSRLGSSETRKARCTTSGKDGHYRIDDLFGVRQVVTASAAGHIPAAYVRGEGAARREHLDLRPAMEARDIDIVLEGGGVEIRGVVKDLSGGAIEGAQVVAGERAISFTGADGAFTTWVRPGGGYVVASAEGYASGSDSGATPGHMFEVFLVPEAVLVGKVVRVGDGSPVEGARVTAEAGGYNWNGAAAFTDAGGNFRLDGLSPGPYKARAEADDAVGLADEQAILGLGETSEPIVIKAHPAFSVRANVVIVGGGDGCDTARVSLVDKPNDRTTYATGEADGSVHLRGLLPGVFEVNVRCKGLVSAEKYPLLTIVDKSLAGIKWEVSRGQAIRGLVVDDRGKPVPRVNVSAAAKPDPSQPRAHQTSTWGDETDDQGRFELAGLLAGEYNVSVSAWNEPRAVPPKPVPVTLRERQDVSDLRIELPATGEVRGSVRDPQGKPVPGVQVSLSDGAAWQNVSVGDDGNFSFPHVAAGEYRVVARSRSWDALRAPGTSDDDVQGEKVSVDGGGVEVVKLVVESASGKISGVVRDADGGPVADAFIDATRESDSAATASGGAVRESRWGSFWRTPHLTDQDGRFTLEELPTGKHTLRAHRKGGGEAILEHVELGGDVVLTIASAGRMTGTVTLRGGGSPEEFNVAIEDEATGFRRNDSFFRTAGAWSLDEVPAGKYKVRVNAGPGSAEVEAAMTAGQDTTGVRVELAPKVTVRGKVVDLDGEPVAGLRVSVSAEGSFSFGGGDQEKLNITDAAGRYEVAHAPTGQVQVSVMPRNWQDEEWGWTWMPARIEASEAAVELPPIRVSKKRVKEGEAAGDLGYMLKQEEPGSDPMQRKAVVAVVRPGSPAAAAGLLAGDEITTVDGQDVSGANTYLHGALTHVLEGTTVTLGLARGASVQIKAGKRP